MDHQLDCKVMKERLLVKRVLQQHACYYERRPRSNYQTNKWGSRKVKVVLFLLQDQQQCQELLI